MKFSLLPFVRLIGLGWIRLGVSVRVPTAAAPNENKTIYLCLLGRALYSKYQHIGVVEEQLRASKEEMERCLSEYDELFRTIQRLSEELNTQISANGVLQVR